MLRSLAKSPQGKQDLQRESEEQAALCLILNSPFSPPPPPTPTSSLRPPLPHPRSFAVPYSLRTEATPLSLLTCPRAILSSSLSWQNNRGKEKIVHKHRTHYGLVPDIDRAATPAPPDVAPGAQLQKKTAARRETRAKVCWWHDLNIDFLPSGLAAVMPSVGQVHDCRGG